MTMMTAKASARTKQKVDWKDALNKNDIDFKKELLMQTGFGILVSKTQLLASQGSMS